MENKNYVFRVSALYDMNIDKCEEIIQEIYATEKLAQKRVRYLIDTYKSDSHVIEDCEPYGGEWHEDEYRLYAYMDSEWNVDISYVKDEIRTCLEHGNAETERIKSMTLTFDIYEGKDGQTWFVEKYKEVESGKNLYRYGFGETDNWTTVCEGLTKRPNLKKMKLIK